MTQLEWINGGWKTSPYAKVESAGFGIDVDGLFGFQCKDFVQAYSIFLGKPFTNGNAITLLNPQPGWTWTTSPQAGDVFVRHAVFGGVDFGDTGIVESVTPGGVNVIQQNLKADLLNGSPPGQMFWTFNQLIGYLRTGDTVDIEAYKQLQADHAALQNKYNVDTTNLRKQTEDVTAIVKQREATIAELQTQITALEASSEYVAYSGPQLYTKK